MKTVKKPSHTPPAPASLAQRKRDHIRASLEDGVDLARDSFGPYKLRYSALPEMALEEVSTRCTFAGKTIAAPLIISCMTGGVGREFDRINRNLALGAQALNIPLGLGSMKVLLEHPEAEASFKVRNFAPDITVIANLGLVSFNYGLDFSHLERIVELVDPDVLGLHLNPLQEAIQEGGDTDFRNLLARLEEIVGWSRLPVYLKECGGGIAPELVGRLAAAGVDYIDISGNDGTSWAAVEGKLSADSSLGELFKDFGLPTAWILDRLTPDLRGRAAIVASGGIRNGLQAVKAFAMGAQYVSVARPFLIAAMDSADAVIAEGKRMIQEMRVAMFLVSAKGMEDLTRDSFVE